MARYKAKNLTTNWEVSINAVDRKDALKQAKNALGKGKISVKLLSKKTTVYKTARMKSFKSGAPQATFTRRDGKKFTKTFKTISSRQKAINAWVASGGTRPKKGVYRK